MKKKILYLTAAVIVATVAFAGCKKNEEPDPKQQKIAELTALANTQANEVRAAVQPAKTQPNDITPTFNASFDGAVFVLNKGQPKNIADSSEVFVKMVNDFEEAFGDPIPKNDATLKALRTKSITYLITFAELETLKDSR